MNAIPGKGIIKFLYIDVSIDFMLKPVLFALCMAIGYYGYRRNVIDRSGLLACLAIGAIVLAAMPIVWFFPLLVLFVLGGITAKYKWEYKKRVGIAERKKGRSVCNVLGNGLVAAFSAILYFFFPDEIFIYAFICSVASACADSVATEIGQLSRTKPRLITSFGRVPVGTDGAISLLGELAGAFGAFCVAAVPFLFFGISGYWNLPFILIVTFSGFLACQVDSLIGATLEHRGGVFNNHTTNFLATLSGALIGVVLFVSI